MRKKVTGQGARSDPRVEQGWLNLEELAEVEVSSEEPQHPIESALLPDGQLGWRAGEPGPQRIRLIFNDPQRITRISLHFVEAQVGRTQEFVLRWSPDGGRSFREIVRQEWNFSPDGATEQVEEYQVSLSEVTVLELEIIPDKSKRSDARASLAKLRLA